MARDPPKVEDQVRFLAGALFASVADARRPSKPQGRVRFPGGGPRPVLLSLGCDGAARDPAKVEDQVQFLARTFLELLTFPRAMGAGGRRPGRRGPLGRTPSRPSSRRPGPLTPGPAAESDPARRLRLRPDLPGDRSSRGPEDS